MADIVHLLGLDGEVMLAQVSGEYAEYIICNEYEFGRDMADFLVAPEYVMPNPYTITEAAVSAKRRVFKLFNTECAPVEYKEIPLFNKDES